MPDVEQVVDALGGRAVLRRAVRSWDDLDSAVQGGLPKRSLQHVARRVVEPGASIAEFVYSIVPPATFKRRTRLSVGESERTERLARVVAAAEAVWGDRREARAFLNRPSLVAPGLERNVLINQRHPQFDLVTATAPAPLRCHPRLLVS